MYLQSPLERISILFINPLVGGKILNEISERFKVMFEGCTDVQTHFRASFVRTQSTMFSQKQFWDVLRFLKRIWELSNISTSYSMFSIYILQYPTNIAAFIINNCSVNKKVQKQWNSTNWESDSSFPSDCRLLDVNEPVKFSNLSKRFKKLSHHCNNSKPNFISVIYQ